MNLNQKWKAAGRPGSFAVFAEGYSQLMKHGQRNSAGKVAPNSVKQDYIDAFVPPKVQAGVPIEDVVTVFMPTTTAPNGPLIPTTGGVKPLPGTTIPPRTVDGSAPPKSTDPILTTTDISQVPVAEPDPGFVYPPMGGGPGGAGGATEEDSAGGGAAEVTSCLFDSNCNLKMLLGAAAGIVTVILYRKYA